MLDPFPFSCPPALAKLTKEYAAPYNLSTLHLHIHEIILSALAYHFIYLFVSPFLSSRLCPRSYRKLDYRSKLNWDVHVVSLFQSLMINAIAIYVTLYDDERQAMGERERIWGYTGATGMIAAFAVGYFTWDLLISIRYVSIFGPGLVAHAVSALAVYSFGFRPFVNWYAPGFILFELSSPFLNFHWFLDKLDMTGSNTQLFNGILLMSSFFGSRLVWGSYLSFKVFSDMYKAVQYQSTPDGKAWLASLGTPKVTFSALHAAKNPRAAAEVLAHAATNRNVPLWMAAIYITSNIVLMALNVVWFGKMIETIRKRFEPPLGTKSPDHVKMEDPVMGRGVTDSIKSVEINSKSEVRKRAPIRRLSSDAPPPS